MGTVLLVVVVLQRVRSGCHDVVDSIQGKLLFLQAEYCGCAQVGGGSRHAVGGMADSPEWANPSVSTRPLHGLALRSVTSRWFFRRWGKMSGSGAPDARGAERTSAAGAKRPLES
jgi:hypothetical protein